MEISFKLVIFLAVFLGLIGVAVFAYFVFKKKTLLELCPNGDCYIAGTAPICLGSCKGKDKNLGVCESLLNRSECGMPCVFGSHQVCQKNN